MGKAAAGTLRTILLPCALLAAGATLAGVSLPSANERAESIREIEGKATVTELMVSVVALQQAVMHEHVSGWSDHFVRPRSDETVIQERIDDLQIELIRSKRNDVDLSTVQSQLRNYHTNPVAKGRSNALDGMVDEVRSLVLDIDTERAGSEPKMAEVQKIFQAMPKFLSLGQLVTTVRAGSGVDPMPTDPELRTFITGVTAGSRQPRWEGHQSQGVHRSRQRTHRHRSFRQGDLRTRVTVLPRSPLDGWRPGPNVPHPPLAKYIASTNGLIDDITAVLDVHLGQLDSSLRTKAALVDRQRDRLVYSGLAGIAMVLLAGLWLTLRVSRSLRNWRRASESDSLTALPNRAGLRTGVAPWFASKNRTLGVAVVDIDHFKHINDSYGHEVGDHLLVAFVQRLCAQVVSSSTSVARWGG